MPMAFAMSGMDPYSYREYLFNPRNGFNRDQIAYGLASLMNGMTTTRGAATPRAKTQTESKLEQLLSQIF